MSFNSDGSAATSSAVPKFKSFVSEGEIEEKRKKRQEEWEKVRKPEEPLEAPEETYDGRSLFDRLQEQKDRKQTEYEESHKLKNLIRGLDDDEVSFLELVDKTKIEMESRILKEELHELNEYRKAVATLSEESAAARLQDMKKNILMGDQHKKTKQQDPLLKAIKRKSSTGESSSSSTSAEKQRKVSQSEEKTAESSNQKDVLVKKETEKINNGLMWQRGRATQGSLQCIGVLPGLGVYSDSSDSENSSGSESPDCDPSFDLVGRRRIIHAHGSTNS